VVKWKLGSGWENGIWVETSLGHKNGNGKIHITIRKLESLNNRSMKATEKCLIQSLSKNVLERLHSSLFRLEELTDIISMGIELINITRISEKDSPFWGLISTVQPMMSFHIRGIDILQKTTLWMWDTTDIYTTDIQSYNTDS
jgi:hypothetical protein